MPSEMVERVAVAVERAQEDALEKSPAFEYRLDFELMARAAIAAMSEPTEAMVNRGAAECGTLGAEDGAFDVAKWCWQAMIDAALDEKAKSTDG